MRKLIIITHPSSKGFTHRIAKSCKKGAEHSGYKADIIDLYKEENK